MAHRTITNPLPQFQPISAFGPSVAGSPQVETTTIFDALVIDVIVNETHPEFSADGYNVGCVKFRILASQFHRPQETLQWAFPIQETIEEFPLINELIRVYGSLRKFYYTRKINLGNRPVHQAFFGLESEMGPGETAQSRIEDYRQSSHATRNLTNQTSSTLGSYFKEMPNVHRLRHDEGDKIFEGRMGQSIRFGTSWKQNSIHKHNFLASTSDQSPNIIIRVGQSTEVAKIPGDKFGRVVENINDDKGSIWMVTDQRVNLSPATKNNSTIHHKSVRTPPPYTGNQIFVNTDRIVLNSKTDRIFMYSAAGNHVITLKDATLDAERDYIS